MASELLHWSWIFELMEKSWFRWNCIGDDKLDPPGIRLTMGAKQP
jgi:hypothetical protein